MNAPTLVEPPCPGCGSTGPHFVDLPDPDALECGRCAAQFVPALISLPEDLS